jgi:TetR/AcrR family transcriptional repressor of nem operon
MSADGRQPVPSDVPAETTRDQLVVVATDVIRSHGLHAFALDDVAEAAGLDALAVARHFATRDDVVEAVVDRHVAAVLHIQEPLLDRVNTLTDLLEWRDNVVLINRRSGGSRGCPMASLINVVTDDDAARRALAAGFDRWEDKLAGALGRLQVNGELTVTTDPAALATATLALLQGGLLLALTAHDPGKLALALDMAFNNLGVSAGAWS